MRSEPMADLIAACALAREHDMLLDDSARRLVAAVHDCATDPVALRWMSWPAQLCREQACAIRLMVAKAIRSAAAQDLATAELDVVTQREHARELLRRPPA